MWEGPMMSNREDALDDALDALREGHYVLQRRYEQLVALVAARPEMAEELAAIQVWAPVSDADWDVPVEGVKYNNNPDPRSDW